MYILMICLSLCSFFDWLMNCLVYKNKEIVKNAHHRLSEPKMTSSDFYFFEQTFYNEWCKNREKQQIVMNNWLSELLQCELIH